MNDLGHPWETALEGTIQKMAPVYEAAVRFAKAHIESDRLDRMDDVEDVPEDVYAQADAEYNASKAALIAAYKRCT